MSAKSQPGERVTLKSRAGYPKPISPAQVAALRVIGEGDVYWHDRLGLMGVRADVYEVLERNELVEVLDETLSGASRSHPVALTTRGTEILEGLG